jgi:hypothetical protein
MLKSTLLHEIDIHLYRHVLVKGQWGKTTLGVAVNEVEAYDAELRNPFGLSQSELRRIRQDRDDYYNQLDSFYKKRIDSFKYQIVTCKDNGTCAPPPPQRFSR